jgi:hypothetical protein
MLKKYIPLMNNIFEYVRNRTVVDAPVNDIVDEVLLRFSPEILFHEVSNEGLRDIIMTLAKYAYFLHHNEAYDRP